MIPVWWLIFVVIVCLLWVIYLFRLVSLARVRAEAVESVETENQILWDSNHNLAKEMESERTQAIEQREQREKWERLAKTHMEKNEVFEKQAKEAWQRYQQAGLMAGNGQAMLLHDLERAVQELNKYKERAGEKPVQVNPELAPMVAEFKTLHGGGQ